MNDISTSLKNFRQKCTKIYWNQNQHCVDSSEICLMLTHQYWSLDGTVLYESMRTKILLLLLQLMATDDKKWK